MTSGKSLAPIETDRLLQQGKNAWQVAKLVDPNAARAHMAMAKEKAHGPLTAPWARAIREQFRRKARTLQEAATRAT